jgi:hypothetical protein
MLYQPREHDPHWRSSLRWESFRQGLDEYDLLMVLQERAEGAAERLGVRAEFDAEAMMQDWASMLATGFRLQTYRAEAAWIHRFRQLIAHEIEALEGDPVALVSVTPVGALLSTPATIKPGAGSETEFDSPAEATISGYCGADATVTVAGEAVEMTADGGRARFSHKVALEPGANLIAIEVTGADGARSVFLPGAAAPARSGVSQARGMFHVKHLFASLHAEAGVPRSVPLAGAYSRTISAPCISPWPGPQ